MGTIVKVDQEIKISDEFMNELSKLTKCMGFGLNQISAEASFLYSTLVDKARRKKVIIVKGK